MDFEYCGILICPQGGVCSTHLSCVLSLIYLTIGVPSTSWHRIKTILLYILCFSKGPSSYRREFYQHDGAPQAMFCHAIYDCKLCENDYL